MRTEGDRLEEVRLGQAGGKGLFVREIEEALLAGGIDLAVHSLKDLPADLPAGLRLAAFPRREDPRDLLVTRGARWLADLPPGPRGGASSLRRRALLLAARVDLTVLPLRGHVDTRLPRRDRGARGCGGGRPMAGGFAARPGRSENRRTQSGTMSR